MSAVRWERGQGQNHWRGMLGSACVVVLQVLDEPVLKDKDLRSLTFTFDLVHFMRGAARETIGRISLAEAKRRAERSVADSLTEMGVVLAKPEGPSLADTLIKEGEYVLETIFGRTAFCEPDVCRVAERLTGTTRQYLATVLADKYGTDLGDTEEETLEILAEAVAELREKSQ